jgi:hypothetical protein
MYLNAYVPQLTSEAGVAGFVRGHLGYRFASTKQVAQMPRLLWNRSCSLGSITKSTWSDLKRVSARTMSCRHGCALSKRIINKEWSSLAWLRKRHARPNGAQGLWQPWHHPLD